MTSAELQRLVLQVLASGADTRLGGGRHYLAEAVRHVAPNDDRPSSAQIQAAVWGLVGRGLAYIDMSQRAPENWDLRLTSDGRALLQDDILNPDDPSGYLRQLYDQVPGLSDLAKRYIVEAIQTYYHGGYLASTVMLGVAAEAIVLDVGAALAEWLDDQAGENLRSTLASGRKTYVQKFEAFRDRLIPNASRLPAELGDGLDLQLNAVLDLLRVNRNEAGHPTGVIIERDDAFVSLRVFARAAKRLYGLKAAFSEAS